NRSSSWLLASSGLVSRASRSDAKILTKSSGRVQVARRTGSPSRCSVGGELPVRILVVEDEAKVARALQEGLEAEHYEVVVSATGEDGFFRLNAETFDLIVLDLMLPGRDGIEILTTLRKRGLGTPALILTARDGVEDRVHGLDSGADDYLVKPFAFPE